MPLNTSIQRGRRLSLTSLIDVIFLLLLFFMLSSTFTKFAEVEINAGSSGKTSNAQKPSILITLEKDVWRLNGVRTDSQAVLENIRILTSAKPQTAVMLVRGETTSQQLISAVELLRAISGLNLSVAR